ncbi:MAG: hypothetical protein H6Q70_189 [Firmicutes bacterium]|nr:hypothetical protein [Bacillota bacterium]
MEKLKALLHIDELVKWQITLANTKNFIQDAGLEAVMVEIVANGAAVQIFTSKEEKIDNERLELLEQMKELSNHNVIITACRNALKANSISEELLPDFVTVVPAGITRIIIRQAEGYSYVKP